MNQQGIFHRAAVALFGERAQRLRESTSGAHWLSYLLVTVQSAAVVLALGHQQLQLLLSGDLAVELIAAVALFLLVSSVVAADLCLLATLQRVPVLARNRATWALVEHLAYLAFVLAVEGSTLALVLAVLDTDPAALVSAAPIIPAGTLYFAAQIGARAALTCWTAVQLWIVRGKLPPQWSTLLLEARELLGGKAQQVMSGLNLDSATLAALFDAYAQMSRPPAVAPHWWNKGTLRRLAEEDRQRAAVVNALATFDKRAGDVQQLETETPQPSGRPPTGPGSPTAAPVASAPEKAVRAPVLRLADPDAPMRRRPAAARRARASMGVRTGATMRTAKGVRTPDSYERAAREAWANGVRSIAAMRKATGASQSTAQAWVRALVAEESGRVTQVEGEVAQ